MPGVCRGSSTTLLIQMPSMLPSGVPRQFGGSMMGLRDWVYYFIRVIIWIHTLAMCKSLTFRLPSLRCNAAGFHDLQWLLASNCCSSPWDHFITLSVLIPGFTPSHVRWLSNVLLHFSWALPIPDSLHIIDNRESINQINMPLDVLLNHLLVYCNLFGSPVEEELLKVQDKS
jgi:hypothetical protein